MSRRAETAAQTSQLDPLSGPVNPINYQVSEHEGPGSESGETRSARARVRV